MQWIKIDNRVQHVMNWWESDTCYMFMAGLSVRRRYETQMTAVKIMTLASHACSNMNIYFYHESHSFMLTHVNNILITKIMLKVKREREKKRRQ